MQDYCGIEIGGTKLQLVVGSERGRIFERRKLPVEAAKGAAGIRNQIERALPELARDYPFNAVGVGFGGPVHWRSGRICRSHQIEGWSDFDLSGWLNKLIGAPVSVDNDANVAALGEATLGAGAGRDPVFYVTLGSGVGGGLVADGKIYHGAAPGESEIGHLRMDDRGTILESRCSGWAIDARIRALQSKGVFPPSAHKSRGGEAKALGAALRKGNRAAKRILLDLAQDLALGLSHVVHLFHPQILILGGGLSGIGQPLRRAVEDSLRRLVMDAFAPGPALALAALGEDAVPVGALILARSAR